MKRFSLFTYNCSEEETKAWEDMGFVVIKHQDLVDYKPLDVIFGHLSGKDDAFWGSIKDIMPKVLVITGHQAIEFPGCLSRLYERQVICGRTVSFSLGSIIDGKVKEPDWETRAVEGVLTTAGQVKDLAGAVYSFLLEDIIRENEDWCGHMSSVVGPV